MLNAYHRFRGVLWLSVAPLLMAIIFFWTQSRYGFFPADDGEMLAQAWRIANGQVPHSEFDSIRPAGSALLHAPVTFLPWGMLAIDRLLVTLQLTWIAVGTVSIAARGRQIWPETYFLLVLIAFLVNVGVWPVLAWHTIDGLFVAVTALWLLDRTDGLRSNDYAVWGLAWVLAGAAPLMKQGFVLAPVALLVLAVSQRKWRALLVAPAAALPLIVYATISGPSAFVAQVTRSTAPGESLAPLSDLIAFSTTVLGLATIVGVVLSVIVAKRLPAWKAVAALLAILLWSWVLPLLPMWSGSFGLSGNWAWACALFLLVLLAIAHPTDRQLGLGVALLSLGYAVSLSRGVPGPGLTAGGFIALSVVILMADCSTTPSSTTPRVQDDTSHHGPLATLRGFILVLTLAFCITIVSTAWRNNYVYGEGARSDLTSTVDHPQFALIQMSPRSAAYINNAVTCLEEHPASHSAIVPDGPALYPLLGMRNPFRNDWWYPGEIDFLATGEGERLHQADVDSTIDLLNETNDWLVMVQTRQIHDVSSPTQVATPGETPFGYYPGDVEIVDRLNGIEVTCGMLTGKYRPPGYPATP